MNVIKKNIPNTITCGNLLCGCLAIIKIFEGDLVWAAYLVGIAAVLDFFDGFAARLLKVSSPIGKDLDSLADLVTFGVVPGMMMMHLIQYYCEIEQIKSREYSVNEAIDFSYSGFAYLGLLIPIFSAIRLAKFNNDIRQSESFIGLPTPANAILICSIPFFINISNRSVLEFFKDYYLDRDILNTYILIVLTIILCFLLIAELPLFALKFKHFKFKGNEIKYVFLGFSLLLLIFLKLIAIPLIIISYVLFSVVNNLLFKKNKVSE